MPIIGFCPQIATAGQPMMATPGRATTFMLDDVTTPIDLTDPAVVSAIAAFGPSYVLLKALGGRNVDYGNWGLASLQAHRAVIVVTTAARIPVWVAALQGLRDFNDRAAGIDTAAAPLNERVAPTNFGDDAGGIFTGFAVQ